MHTNNNREWTRMKISRKADFAPSPSLATSAEDAKAQREDRRTQMDADVRRLGEEWESDW